MINFYKTLERRAFKKKSGRREGDGQKENFHVFKTQRQIADLVVNWCFEPSQPLGIISGLRETFIKRDIVERTNKA